MDQDGNERHQLYLHSPGGVDVVPLTGTPEIKHIIGPWSPDTGAIALTDGLGSVDLG